MTPPAALRTLPILLFCYVLVNVCKFTVVLNVKGFVLELGMGFLQSSESDGVCDQVLPQRVPSPSRRVQCLTVVRLPLVKSLPVCLGNECASEVQWVLPTRNLRQLLVGLPELSENPPFLGVVGPKWKRP